MRRLLFVIGLCGLFINAYTQENQVFSDKKGNPVLPRKGDFGFGISATPLLNYIGNMFGNAGNNTFFLSLPGNAIYAKYFTGNNTAIRFGCELLLSSETILNEVDDNLNDGATLTDRMKETESDIVISFGYEKRLGEKRLQFFYGGELRFLYAHEKTVFTYGNTFSEDNTHPSTTLDFITGVNYRTTIRTLETASSSGIGAGLRGFAGIEYFILPKVSVGGEFGLGYTQYFGGKNTDTEESWDFVNNEVVTDITELTKSRSLVASDISSGMVFVMFYF